MGVDVGLFVYLTAWYAGNYYYNIYNKLAAKEAGGTTYAMTLATIQMWVGAIYAIALWVAPEARSWPKITFAQFVALAPLGFFAAAAHAGAVFAMSAGAVSFGQIVKAAEPAFAAAVGFLVYNSKISSAKMIVSSQSSAASGSPRSRSLTSRLGRSLLPRSPTLLPLSAVARTSV